MVPEMPDGPALPGIARQAGLSRLDVNLPNLITLTRLLSVPVAIWLIAEAHYGVAFWVFVLAGLSDALDGYIAKRWDQRTPLGAIMDPIADKALLAGVCITLGLAGELPHWLVILVVLRDFLIVGGYLVTHGARPPQPLFISKVNTLMQIALIGFVLARLGFDVEAGLVTMLLVTVAGVTTVWSGLSYLAHWARCLARGI